MHSLAFHTFLTRVNFVVWSISDIKSKDEPKEQFWWLFRFFCKSLLVCWQVPATLKKDEKSSAGCGSWELESKLQFSTGMLAIDQLLWSTCRFKWATSKTPFFILSKRVTLRTSCKQNYQGTGRLVSKSQGFMHFLDAFIGLSHISYPCQLRSLINFWYQKQGWAKGTILVALSIFLQITAGMLASTSYS